MLQVKLNSVNELRHEHTTLRATETQGIEAAREPMLEGTKLCIRRHLQHQSSPG
jgi:hypothetical protein